jgi:hypothetical protein
MNSSKRVNIIWMITLLSLILSIPLVIAPSTMQQTNICTSLEEKILDIISIVEGLDLSKGKETSLTNLLENAINALTRGNDNAAVNMLNAFIEHVLAQRGKGLSFDDADALVAEAQIVIALLRAAPDVEWIQLYDSNVGPGFELDSGQSVVQTLDGGYVIAGYTHLGPQDGPGPWLNIWLIKTNSYGVEEWNNTFGSGSRHDKAFSVIKTLDGGFLIAGEFFNEGFGDAVLIKTYSNGAEEWSQYYGNILQGYVETANDVVQTDDGYVFAGTNNDYVGGLGSRIWLVKTDEDGEVSWEKILADGVGSSVRQTLDNGFIVSGHNDDGMLLIKTDDSGNVVWEKTFGEPFDEGMNAIQTSDGGYVLAGSKLIKTDSDGNMIWENDYEGQSVKETSDGGYILSSLIKVDSNGILEWEISDLVGFDVELTVDGGCVITGVYEADVLLAKIANFQ